METQLFFDLTAQPPHAWIHFAESEQVEEIAEELRAARIAILEIDGATLSTEESVFKAFAIALRKPKGWYGDEEYPTNVDAWLEYLDDVVDWIPAHGHVVLVRSAEQLWRTTGRLAGELVEWWQFSISGHQGTVHLVFVW